jgi:adenosylmethionine---8-amino-7-oxononanoate aminotransferase
MDNQNLLARSLASVWHPCTQMKQHETLPLVPIARAQGVWLHDFDGRRYLDAISSWWVNLFGHANPRINAAVRNQLETLEHVMLAGFTHEPAVELSERLARLTGLGHCFYASDGACAVEIALKMSFHAWRNRGKTHKSKFLSLENSYHGETIGALAVGDVALFKSAYQPLLVPSVQAPSPDWRRASPGESPEAYARRCAQALKNHLSKHADQVAALIVEPLVQCAGGMAMYHAEYLRLAREICDRHEVHLIADEIAVGFGRTGSLFACEQAGIRADFLCLSKGLSGGYLPLSVVLTTENVFQAFYDDDTARGFLHSHSYTGNPLACRAALATLDIFEADQVLESNKQRAAYFNRALMALSSHPKVKDFRNQGMIWAFEVESSEEGFSSRFFAEALKKGLLLRPLGNTVYFMPPYVITGDELDFLASATLEVLEQNS